MACTPSSPRGGSKIVEKKSVGKGQKVLLLEEQVNFSRWCQIIFSENEKMHNHSIRKPICLQGANIVKRICPQIRFGKLNPAEFLIFSFIFQAM